MGVTSIPWADYTFNPWLGCTKVQPECTHCYAENETPVRVHRGRGLELWGPKAARHVTSEETWKQPLRWNRVAELSTHRPRVFCASLADVFEDRPDLIEPRTRLLNVIEATPRLDWLLLTKRPENVNRLTARWFDVMPSNVWVGTTGGTQKTLERNLRELMTVNARVRVLSIEPLLERVELDPMGLDHRDTSGRAIDWVIVGGESGHEARPCALEWIESVVEECRLHGIPCLVKQLGAAAVRILERPASTPPWEMSPRENVILADRKGEDPAEWPAHLQLREFPREAQP